MGLLEEINFPCDTETEKRIERDVYHVSQRGIAWTDSASGSESFQVEKPDGGRGPNILLPTSWLILLRTVRKVTSDCTD